MTRIKKLVTINIFIIEDPNHVRRHKAFMLARYGCEMYKNT